MAKNKYHSIYDTARKYVDKFFLAVYYILRILKSKNISNTVIDFFRQEETNNGKS